jgi:hypothetical protein
MEFMRSYDGFRATHWTSTPLGFCKRKDMKLDIQEIEFSFAPPLDTVSFTITSCIRIDTGERMLFSDVTCPYCQHYYETIIFMLHTVVNSLFLL